MEQMNFKIKGPNLKSQAGFSLVELMVTVAIIGMLSAVSVTAYSKFSLKSREAEAKSNLGALFASQKAFHATYGMYHTSFQALGYSPDGMVHYNLGFGAVGVTAGPAQGFNLPIDIWAISTKNYCGGVGGSNAGGNHCQMAKMTPDLHWAFTAYPTGGFAAAATLDASLYAQNEFEGSNEGPRMTAMNAILTTVLGSELAHALAQQYFRPALEMGHQTWVIDENKYLRKIND